ncbi:SURF1 family protein [Caenimonas soli]|uniref:SURF1 family protein n=1 Tax=Caenimonas soli TaxID=2735555 RepID=UPI002E27C2ED|nr:SURF1 family protein [Caenimonas soli]
MTGTRSARFWLVTFAALAALAATLALGAWQMSRAGQKLALEAAMQVRGALPTIDQQTLLAAAAATSSTADLLHRPVILRGTWLPQHTVFLDNRQMRGKPGFYVVTPLKLEASPAAVLVERGWVQRNFVQRDKLPPVDTPPGVVELRGRMAPPPGKLYEFGGAGGGAIRQNIDLAQFRAETGLALLDLAVQQTGEPSEGLLREWPEAASGAPKHYGYAFQWWALSALIAILYVWFQFIAPLRKLPHA